MHPRISELLQYIDAEREKLRSAVDSVPVERRTQSPGVGQWSVAGVLDHLGTVEQRVATVFRTRTAEARASGVANDADTTPILPLLNLEQFTDRTQRLNSPNAVQPSSTIDSDTAWSALEASRRDFRDAVLAADGLALDQVAHPHLYFGWMSLYKWIGFIGAHEARHADQIREIGATLSSGPA